MILEVIDSPSPTPPSVRFVVKKGSKTFFLTSSGIPTPVSATWMQTFPFLQYVRISILPPLGIAWQALVRMFKNTCCRRSGFALTSGRCLEGLKSKFLKDKKLRIKTKELTRVLVTDGKM
jgi:hypothetical protein